MSVVLFRAASLSLGLDSFLAAASFTLLIVLILQIAIMGIMIGVREPEQFKQLIRHWKPAALVGITVGIWSERK